MDFKGTESAVTLYTWTSLLFNSDNTLTSIFLLNMYKDIK